MYRSCMRVTTRTMMMLRDHSNTTTNTCRKRYFTWSTTQRTLLRTALEHVPEHGWTQDAVAAAVSSNNNKNQNSSIAVTGLVQAPYDLISFCMDDWNDQLRQTLMERANTDEHWNTFNLVERLTIAFQTRLELQKELVQVNRWHEAIAIGARPEYVYTTTEKLQEMVETVCMFCEDMGENNNNNTATLNQLEKLSLGAIYVAAELHMVSTQSISNDETWDFLHQQLLHWDMLRNTTTSSSLTNLPVSASTIAYVSSTLVSSLTSGLASLLLPSQRPFPAK